MTFDQFKAQVSAQWPGREITFSDYVTRYAAKPEAYYDWLPGYGAYFWRNETKTVGIDYKETWANKWRASVADCYGDDEHDFGGAGDTLAEAINDLTSKVQRHIAPFTAVLEAVA